MLNILKDGNSYVATCENDVIYVHKHHNVIIFSSAYKQRMITMIFSQFQIQKSRRKLSKPLKLVLTHI